MDWLVKQNPKDLADIALMAGLAYAGARTTKHWTGALIGPVSFRLATTPGGTPPISQIAGVTGLAALGLAQAFDIVGDAVSMIVGTPELQERYDKKELKNVALWATCGKGWHEIGRSYIGDIFVRVCERDVIENNQS